MNRRGISSLMLRMKDLAAQLGLSQTTVSHVLSGRHREFRISAKTVARVQKLVDKLGYRSNALARSLRERRSYSVALIVEDLTNPFWTGIVTGAEREAEKRGYMLVVANTAGDLERERRALSLLRDGRVDGLLLPPFPRIGTDLQALRREKLPFVQIDRALPRVAAPCVRTDHEAGSRMAVDHLVKRGHRHIALLVGPNKIQPYALRTRGFVAALAQHGLGTPQIVSADTGGEQDGLIAARELLQKTPRATAIHAANVVLTVALLRAVRDAGLEVPRDIEIVGFDDIALGDLLRFAVTTVAQDVETIGREAFRALMEIRDGGEARRELLVPPSLVVR